MTPLHLIVPRPVRADRAGHFLDFEVRKFLVSCLGFRVQLDPSMNSGSTLSGSAELTVEANAERVKTRNSRLQKRRWAYFGGLLRLEQRRG